MTESVGIAELKARLSSFLKMVKAGQEILILDRGVPVAKVVPLGQEELRAGRRERLAKAGLLRLGRGRVRPSLVSVPRGRLKGKTLLATLLEEREEGR